MVMDPRLRRGLGAASAGGGLLAAVVNVPSAWYGAAGGDSYVFDPPAFSPLWFERVAVPAASLLAGALLLAGLFGLVYRDWGGATDVRRAAGVVALLGLGVLEVAQTAIHATPAGTAGVLASLVALLAAAVGLVLLGAGLTVLGVGYLRAGATRLGYALLGGPLLSVAVTAVGVASGLGTAGGLAAVLPWAVAFVVAGHDLRGRGVAVEPAGDDPAMDHGDA